MIHDYYNKKFDKSRKDPKNTWKLINEVISDDHSKKREMIKLKNDDNVLISDGRTIANEFNDYFTNIGEDLASRINETSQPDILNFQYSISSDLKFEHTNVNEISKIISNLKNTSSTGIDNISTKTLKEINNIISPLLTILINECLDSGVFPDSLKNSKIIPIFKGGDKYNKSNYRPIALLPILSKIFEKVIKIQLMKHLMNNGLLSKSQYAYIEASSTTYALFDYVSKIQNSLDNKKKAASIFLDLCKAFDTVNHEILLLELDKMKIKEMS